MLLHRLLWRIRALFTKRKLDDAMDEEMGFHLAMETREGIAAGLSPDEARRRAYVAFGGVARFREEGRDARGVRGLDDLAADLRYAARGLRRSPVFAGVAVITLALGIGANTAIFSVVHGVLLKPLPVVDEHALVSVWDGGHSLAEFSRVRDRSKTLVKVAAYMADFGVSLSGEGEPERVVSALVTADFFSVFGLAPIRGRFFREGDDQPGTEPIVVLSQGLWRRRFGGDSSIVGRTIIVDGIHRTVVGIAPGVFRFPSATAQLWMPLELNERVAGPFWGSYGHMIVGRLRLGATRTQAADEVRAIARDLRLENPVWRPGPDYLDGIEVSQLRSRLVSDSRRLLLVLLGAVGLVLLIACANVANLLIVRGAARQRELAVRATLGADPGRLVRQLLTEYGLLALIGGGLGLLLAAAGTRILIGLLPAGTPRLEEIGVDGPVLLFALGLTLATGLGLGLVPAIRQSRGEVAALHTGGRTGLGSRERRLARLLVSAQLALAVVIGVGASLLVRSLARLLEVDPGFQATQVVTALASPPRHAYASAERQRGLYTQVLDRLRAVPGMVAVGMTTQLPFDQTSEIMAMWIDGWSSDPNKLDIFEIRRVSPDYFRAMGTPLRRGRGFTKQDGPNTPLIAIINETAARKFWSGREPIGGRLRYPWPGWLEVVGVVGDVKNNDLTAAAMPALYVPYDQQTGFAGYPQPGATIVARTLGEPAPALAAIRTVLGEVAPDVPLSNEQPMAKLVERAVAAPRSASIVLSLFSGLALILGAIGTYGLVAYGVERRTNEIAVRIAVGAGRRDIIAMVVREGAMMAVAGVGLGLAAAIGFGRVLRGLLFGITPTDPISLAIGPAVLVITALAACLIPAFRAARVEPTGALRRD